MTAHPLLASCDDTASALLAAYTTGTPEAMERYYARTWHRRAWKTMREYVQLDLGKRPAHPGADVPLTLDDARQHVAMEHGYVSWAALAADVSTWPAGALMTLSPVRVHCAGDGSARDGDILLQTRSWDEALDLLAAHDGAVLDGNGQVTDAVLERLRTHPTLRALHLGGSKAISDDGLAHLAALTQLEILDLSGTGVTDAGLGVLPALPHLRRLNCSGTRITDAGLEAHLPSCTRLERLDLLWTHTGDGAIRALAGMDRFRELVSGSHVTDAGLTALRAIPVFATPRDEPLTGEFPERAPNELTLRGPFTDAGMTEVARLPGLANLALHDCGVTAAGMASLSALPQLLMLSCDPDDAWMPHIAALPALRALSAQDTVAGDDGFEALAASRTLERFWGRRCHNLRDRGFRALSRMPALRSLAASCLNVSDDALALLPEFPALRELMPMDVPDAGYRHIGRCSALETLTLMYCRNTTDAATEQITGLSHLRQYFNSYTTITDRTPQLLATMPSLEEVTLSACNEVTDEGVVALAALPRLRRLDVSGRRLTPALAGRFPTHVTVRVAP